ncbi:unnamed protein product [Paramecium sonneborni]|uniref:Transmembrane protein n=1 Tax=Paramecium sonneborni TaxID=65129 RepID=A0A8S1RLZ1_9CILI|nr:unnamed protein product [Paramecium sonneborni]
MKFKTKPFKFQDLNGQKLGFVCVNFFLLQHSIIRLLKIKINLIQLAGRFMNTQVKGIFYQLSLKYWTIILINLKVNNKTYQKSSAKVQIKIENMLKKGYIISQFLIYYLKSYLIFLKCLYLLEKFIIKSLSRYQNCLNMQVKFQ